MRPRRTIRRESTVTVRSSGKLKQRPLVLIVPPTCDVLLIREKGRRTVLEVDILTLYHVAARKAAERRRAERAERKKGKTKFG
jgi:hypothetical protein